MKIALISCVSKKKLGTHKAEDLYISDWFIKAKQYIKQNYKEWYILSAKYGLIRPDNIIENYNEYLPKTTLIYRKWWADNIFENLINNYNNSIMVDIFAGKHYRKYLIPLLLSKNYIVNIPLKGLGIGEQLKWFKNNII